MHMFSATSVVSNSATLWTVACQAPLSITQVKNSVIEIIKDLEQKYSLLCLVAMEIKSIFFCFKKIGLLYLYLAALSLHCFVRAVSSCCK